MSVVKGLGAAMNSFLPSLSLITPEPRWQSLTKHKLPGVG